MANPTFVSGTSVGATGTSVAATAPSSIVAGNLLLASVSLSTTGSVSTVPSGWTLLASDSVSGFRKAAYWKVATGSEPSTYTWGGWSSATSTAVVLQYGGTDPTSPVDDTNGWSSGTSGTSAVTDGIDPTQNSDMLVVFFTGTASQSFSTPSGLASRTASTFGTIRTYSFDKALGAAGHVSSISSTGSVSGAWGGLSVAINGPLGTDQTVTGVTAAGIGSAVAGTVNVGATLPGVTAPGLGAAPVGGAAGSTGVPALATGIAPTGAVTTPSATIPGAVASGRGSAPAGTAAAGQAVTGITATGAGAAPSGTVTVTVAGITAKATGKAPTGTVIATVGGPVPHVEADFSGTPFGGTPVWTDITNWVTDEIEGQWGRQDWLGDVTPATMSLTLNNADGRFTPGLVSSPYWPGVTYGIRVRYREVFGSTTVFMFDGYVTDWTATPSEGDRWTAQVNATDILGRYNQTILNSFLTEEQTLDNPSWLYPLQEPDGSLTFADVTGSQPPATAQARETATGPYTVPMAGQIDAAQGATGLFVAGDVVQVTNDQYLTYTSGAVAEGAWLTLPSPSGSNTFTLEFWVQMPTGGGTESGTIASFGNAFLPSGVGMWLAVTPTGQLALFMADPFGAGVIISSSTTGYCDGNMHMFAVTLGSNHRTVTLYADGSGAVGSGTSGTAFTTLPAAPLVLGMGVNGSSSYFPFTGGYANVAYYPTDIGAARILDHAFAGATAFYGESTDAHVSRLLSYRPNLGQSLDTGSTLVGELDVNGTTMQQALFDTSDAEGTAVYADGKGQINLVGRSTVSPASSVLTLDASQGQVDVASTFRDDSQNVRNDITVTRPNGAAQRYYDPTHVNTYGDYSDQLSLNIDTDADALAIAQWLVRNGILDQLGVPTLTVDCYALNAAGATTVVQQVLQLAPLELVTLTNLPPVAPASTLPVLVQGGSFTRSASEFQVELYTTPAPVA